MKILFIIILIIGGLFLCLCLYPMMKKKKELIKNTGVVTIAKLLSDVSKVPFGQEDTYSDYVTLKGKIKNKDLVISPFTKKEVAYCEAIASVITERRETFKDSVGYDQVKVIRTETIIFNTTLGNILELVDDSTIESAVLEVRCGACQIDVPTIMEKEVSTSEFDSYGLNIELPEHLKNSSIIGYKIKEKLVENDTNVYVIGEARKAGNGVHICLAKDLKKPFIVTTKKMDEVVNSTKDISYIYLIIGIIIIIFGIVLIFI